MTHSLTLISSESWICGCIQLFTAHQPKKHTCKNSLNHSSRGSSLRQVLPQMRSLLAKYTHHCITNGTVFGKSRFDWLSDHSPTADTRIRRLWSRAWAVKHEFCGTRHSSHHVLYFLKNHCRLYIYIRRIYTFPISIIMSSSETSNTVTKSAIEKTLWSCCVSLSLTEILPNLYLGG